MRARYIVALSVAGTLLVAVAALVVSMSLAHVGFASTTPRHRARPVADLATTTTIAPTTTVPPTTTTTTTVPPTTTTTTTTAYLATGPVSACTGAGAVPFFQIPLASGITYFWSASPYPTEVSQICFTTSPDGSAFPEAFACTPGLRGFLYFGPLTYENDAAVFITYNNGSACFTP